MRTWFVTGANRGLGAAIVRAALAAGDRVAAAARSPGAASHERLRWFPLDVTDARQCEAAVAGAIAWAGPIDVLVNNAGYGQIGYFEETAPEAIERQFETNLFGAMRVTRAVLPAMRAARRGHVMAISSVSGFVGDPGASIYCASKFALEGWTEGLAAEVAGFGIKATLIEPGPFRTDFLDPRSLYLGQAEIEDYRPQGATFRTWIEAESGHQVGDPDRLAECIVTLTGMEAPPLRFAAGAIALERLLAKADGLRAEAEAWRTLSLSCDYPSWPA